jgi:hypothetical protein
MGDDGMTAPYGGTKRGRPRFGVNAEGRTPQADVTLNVAITDSMPNKRAELARQLKGSVIGDPMVGSSRMFNIVRGDLIFCLNEQVPRVRHTIPAEMRRTGFAAFNQLPTWNADTQMKYQRFFVFLGVAKTSYNYQDNNQPLNGVSTQRRGATSIFNTGSDVFHPGDFWIPVAPEPNSARRAAVDAQRNPGSFAEDVPQGRIHAVPKLVTYDQALFVPASAFREMLNADTAAINGGGAGGGGGASGKWSLRNLRPNRVADMDQVHYAALSFKQFLLQVSWQTLVVCSGLGLVTLNMPQYGEADAAALDRSPVLLETIDKHVAAAGRSTRVTVGANGAVTGAVKGQPENQIETRREKQLLWAASKLDLFHVDNDTLGTSRTEASPALVSSLLRVHAKHWVNDPRFDVRSLIKRGYPMSQFQPIAPLVARCSDDVVRSPSTAPDQLAKRQHDAFTQHVQGVVDGKRFVESMIGGQALNMCRPGEFLDVLM